ncbi:MAG: UDP-glucose 4-epimerase GalE [Erysipelothrix sp.]|nr:UDP-glucose 4-epimerase GalE [Erysipelothrix sp.]
MHILVTGGAGFIGSHTVVELLNQDHEVTIVDNFYNSSPKVLDAIKEITQKQFRFHLVDVSNQEQIIELFENNEFDAVIHFAGYKAVGESVSKPLSYYFNNVTSTIHLAQACVDYGVNKFVFSSSATVYGDNNVPFKEDMELLPTTNPYGETKAMSERVLMDAVKAHPDLGVSLLRYFNPVGAHPSGLIGEVPTGVPNNLMPYISQVASGQREKLFVFGNDYETTDGTGVRDYIHVVDLAKGHVAALEHLNAGTHIYNLGSGKGTSVLELVHSFEKVNDIKIPYDIVKRRDGDIAISYADASKAKNELDWETKLTIDDMCEDTWRFESKRVTKRDI